MQVVAEGSNRNGATAFAPTTENELSAWPFANAIERWLTALAYWVSLVVSVGFVDDKLHQTSTRS